MPKILYIPKRFTASSKQLIDSCNGIIADYNSQGYKLTLRQLYYQLVSKDIIPNTQKSYDRVGGIINDARLAGEIDWNAIEDRTRNVKGLSTWESPASVMASAAYSYRTDKWARQHYHVEVWVEKEALAGVIQKAANALEVDWLACRGYMSQSEMWAAGQRFLQIIRSGREVVVVHLGDHDPSGIDMSRDNLGRLSMFLRVHLGYEPVEKWEDAEPVPGLTLERIALNMDQVRQYEPPPNPAKVTDSRFQGYSEEFGDESWELDALEPRVLNTLITETVLGYRDENKWNKAEDAETQDKAALDAIYRNWSAFTANLDEVGSDAAVSDLNTSRSIFFGDCKDSFDRYLKDNRRRTIQEIMADTDLDEDDESGDYSHTDESENPEDSED